MVVYTDLGIFLTFVILGTARASVVPNKAHYALLIVVTRAMTGMIFLKKPYPKI